ncbi:sugar phosphate isomerase/epimerase family protein [Kiritimatiella glycovorans]|nr:TIM barrel protein [Kiritimatiella glycovorans]
MKIGYTTQNFIPTVSVSVETARRQLDIARELELSWIELRDPDATLSKADCERIAADARERGLEVLYSMQRGLLAEDFKPVFERALVNAACFEGPSRMRVLALLGEGDTGWSRAEFEQVLASARWAAEKAQAKGRRLMIENADVVLEGSADGVIGMRRLLDELDPAVELQLDTGNLFTGDHPASPEEAAAFIRRYADRISYLHLKSARDGEALPVLDGNPLSFEKIADLLGDRAEPVYAAMELNSGSASEEQVVENMRHSLKHLEGTGCIDPR